MGFGGAGAQQGIWGCGSPAWGLGVREPSEVMGDSSTVLATHRGSRVLVLENKL